MHLMRPIHHLQARGAIAEVREKIDGTQVRKLHDLGFPSRAEVGFAEVVEVAEAWITALSPGFSVYGAL
jgi:hypothetical protein